MITDEMVERAAQAYVDALYDDICSTGWRPQWTWETWPEENRERERRRIRRALEAVLEDAMPDLQQVKELETQCVAMREALRKAIEAIEILHPIMDSQEPCVIYETWQCGKEALSSSAGRDLLERLRKLEDLAKAVDRWNQVREELRSHGPAVKNGTLPEEIQRQDVAKMMAAVNEMVASLQALKTLEGGKYCVLSLS